jgi:hypothetical protein
MTASAFRETRSDALDFEALAAPFLEAQKTQWIALMRFQESLATFYSDLWEQWAVRFAGGLPIDG